MAYNIVSQNYEIGKQRKLEYFKCRSQLVKLYAFPQKRNMYYVVTFLVYTLKISVISSSTTFRGQEHPIWITVDRPKLESICYFKIFSLVFAIL